MTSFVRDHFDIMQDHLAARVEVSRVALAEGGTRRLAAKPPG